MISQNQGKWHLKQLDQHVSIYRNPRELLHSSLYPLVWLCLSPVLRPLANLLHSVFQTSPVNFSIAHSLLSLHLYFPTVKVNCDFSVGSYNHLFMLSFYLIKPRLVRRSPHLYLIFEHRDFLEKINRKKIQEVWIH